MTKRTLDFDWDEIEAKPASSDVAAVLPRPKRLGGTLLAAAFAVTWLYTALAVVRFMRADSLNTWLSEMLFDPLIVVVPLLVSRAVRARSRASCPACGNSVPEGSRTCTVCEIELGAFKGVSAPGAIASAVVIGFVAGFTTIL